MNLNAIGNKVNTEIPLMDCFLTYTTALKYNIVTVVVLNKPTMEEI